MRSKAPGLRILFASLIHHAREKCCSGCFTTPRINCPRNSRASTRADPSSYPRFIYIQRFHSNATAQQRKNKHNNSNKIHAIR
uniref:Uncharacterized protein n=1 Tax=Anopheles quadriannulatus TaxID=34691 RepID=A0A182XGV1_ANOQN